MKVVIFVNDIKPKNAKAFTEVLDDSGSITADIANR